MSSFLADMVIDSMLASGQLEEGAQEKVREAMLRRHHHQNEKKLSNRIPLVRSFADIGKKYSEPNLLERNGETAALLSSSHLQVRRRAAGGQFRLTPPDLWRCSGSAGFSSAQFKNRGGLNDLSGSAARCKPAWR